MQQLLFFFVLTCAGHWKEKLHRELFQGNSHCRDKHVPVHHEDAWHTSVNEDRLVSTTRFEKRKQWKYCVAQFKQTNAPFPATSFHSIVLCFAMCGQHLAKIKNLGMYIFGVKRNNHELPRNHKKGIWVWLIEQQRGKNKKWTKWSFHSEMKSTEQKNLFSTLCCFALFGYFRRICEIFNRRIQFKWNGYQIFYLEDCSSNWRLDWQVAQRFRFCGLKSWVQNLFSLFWMLLFENILCLPVVGFQWKLWCEIKAFTPQIYN